MLDNVGDGVILVISLMKGWFSNLYCAAFSNKEVILFLLEWHWHSVSVSNTLVQTKISLQIRERWHSNCCAYSWSPDNDSFWYPLTIHQSNIINIITSRSAKIRVSDTKQNRRQSSHNLIIKYSRGSTWICILYSVTSGDCNSEIRCFSKNDTVQ